MKRRVPALSRTTILPATFCVAVLFLSSTLCRADYTLYPLPGSGMSIMLEGNVTNNPSGTTTHRHPRGSLYFNAKDIQALKLPTTEPFFAKKLREATQSKNVDTTLDAAKWALHIALTDEMKQDGDTVWHAAVCQLAGNTDLFSSDGVFEQAGGTTAGIKFLLSRSGFGDFPTELSMPYRSNK